MTVEQRSGEGPAIYETLRSDMKRAKWGSRADRLRGRQECLEKKSDPPHFTRTLRCVARCSERRRVIAGHNRDDGRGHFAGF